MPFCSNSVNQIGLKAKIKEEVVKTARAICVMWVRLWLSSDDISDHQRRRKILIEIGHHKLSARIAGLWRRNRPS